MILIRVSVLVATRRPLFALLAATFFLSSLLSASEGEAPVFIPRAQQFDLLAQATGRTYRIQIALPERHDPAKKYPVFYVLDGNWYFAPAAVNLAESSGARELQQAIVVGIGYPTDSFGEFATRRLLELTHSPGPDPQLKTGEADLFLKFLVDELKPWVNARYPVDEGKESLYGKSLSGLAVLRVMFRTPAAFDTYIAASPSIWWNNRDVLADESQFAAKIKAGERDLRLLITVAGEEQYRGTDETKLLQSNRYRMIDNASELAVRLAAVNPEKFSVTYAILPDESHVSVSLASLGRALSFALKSPKQ